MCDMTIRSNHHSQDFVPWLRTGNKKIVKDTASGSQLLRIQSRLVHISWTASPGASDGTACSWTVVERDSGNLVETRHWTGPRGFVLDYTFRIRSGDSHFSLTVQFGGLPSCVESLIASIINRGEVLSFLC